MLPLDGSPFRLTVGVRRVDASAWLEHDDDVAAQLREREAVLAAQHAEAVVDDGAEATRAACDELLHAVADLVSERDSRVWRVAPGAIDVVPTGVRVPLAAAGAHPIDRVAHLVADDLCVLGGVPPVLRAGAVCFPNRWRPRDKLGLPLTAVHGPVPGYEAELATRVDRVVARLAAGAPLVRRNWSVLSDPTLHQPEEVRPAQPVTRRDAGRRLWVRVERQALLRLPITGAVVFSIRTHQRRLDELDDRERRHLVAALRTVPAEMAAYKGVSTLADVAIAWATGRDG